MEIIKLVTFCGIFEVGQSGVRKIIKSDEPEVDYIVFYEKNYKHREVEVRSRDVLVYLG